MTIEEIRELIQLLSDTGIAELEVQRGDNRVRIRKSFGAETSVVLPAASAAPAAAPTPALKAETPPAKTDPDAAADQDFGRATSACAASGTRENFDHYTRDCHNITAIRGRSPDDFADWTLDSLDLVFLDGVHHNPVFHADVTHWFPRVRPGGILCGDDCARTHPDVLWTIDDFCKALGIPFAVERRIWMVRRPFGL